MKPKKESGKRGGRTGGGDPEIERMVQNWLIRDLACIAILIDSDRSCERSGRRRIPVPAMSH
jgi:hypothetical protein